MEKIKVLIADDHNMIRQGLKQILELEDDIEVIAQAVNGDEAVELAKQYEPDIILMDINMPGTNGLQALEKFKLESKSFKVIMLTIHHDKDYLFKTLNLGAQGYVLKDAEPGVLIQAIRNVHNGQLFIQPTMTNELVKEFNRVSLHEKESPGENDLTERELDVLKLIAEGMLNKEIAASLHISEKTVKNHVSNIFRKIDVCDRTQAAIYAIRHNIK